MSVAVASVEKINALKTGIEATTGESYNDLTEAVQDLKNGYGQSGGGEVGKPYIDTSKMTDFSSFVKNNKNLAEDVDKLDTSNGTSFIKMFENTAVVNVSTLDTSNGKYLSSMFLSCKYLKSVSNFSVKKCDYADAIFSGCTALEFVSFIDSPVGGFAPGSFENCGALTNLTIGEGWAASIYLTYSNNLTVESLHGMIENLADLTGKTAKTFQVGETNLAKIDEEHIAMLEAKNWAYS